jgi:hypothetical protein
MSREPIDTKSFESVVVAVDDLSQVPSTAADTCVTRSRGTKTLRNVDGCIDVAAPPVCLRGVARCVLVEARR